MRRSTAFVIVMAVVGTLSLPAAAQYGEGEPNPVQEFINAVQAPENSEYISQFLRQPTTGTGATMDPMGDFGHSSGDTPGYTPDFIDIVDTWALQVDMSEAPIFGPTDGSDPLWGMPTGHVDLPNGMSMHTFTSDAMTHDGSQFDDGMYFFGVTTVGMPPAEHPGRCEFVVWINDTSRPTTWVNDPAFPNDPASGTNMAFGIGINPTGQGQSSAFTLDIGSDGFFQFRPEYDIRGFILDDYVGILVPQSAAPAIGGVNYYTFCVDEGFSFDAADAGSDDTGLIEMTPEDFGLVDIVVAQTTTTTQAPTTTTTVAETTTTTVAETTTTQATTTTVEETPTTSTIPQGGDEGSGFPWILVLGGGLGLAIAGWILYNRPEGDPCRELLEAWKAAQKKCDEATKKASEAREACDEAKSDLEDLEEDRKELCREWPPACWEEDSDGGWIEDDQGNRVTSRDLHLRRQALGEIWSDYKAGKLTAHEVEAKWREADTPEFRHDQRAKDAAAKEELQDLEGEIQMATDDAKKACDKVEAAEAAAKAACDAAAAAKKAYEDCVGAAMATPDPEDAGGEGTDSGPGGTPGVVSGGGGDGSRPDPCEGQPPRKMEIAGRPQQITIAVDFALITEIWEGTERNTEAGREIALSLQEVAQELDLIGDLLSAREAGLTIGGAVNGYAPGKFWSTASGVVRGGANAVLAGASPTIDPPTSIPTAITESLESFAKLGAFIAGKVTEWMTNVQVMQGRLRYFTQTITATPYTVWECQEGVGYVCLEKVWEFEVGKLRRSQPVRTRSFYPNNELERWRMQREFQRVAHRAAGRITRDAQRLADWRQQRQPGPCQ